MSIDIGTTITHGSYEYEIVEEINDGGFGRVFRAKRRPNGADIAVKIPAAHVLAHPIWRKKFAREARILANVKHPNVVKIVAFWEFPDGDMALAQELIEGAATLQEYIPQNPEHAPSVYLQVLYALRAIHGDGNGAAAIHRDLSPRNILVNRKGVVKVIDFGLAKEDPRATIVLTETGQYFGTRGCMAPEQVSDAADVDRRADLFALGRSMTAALQARHPEHAAPHKLGPPWNALCTHLTEHDADDRPQTASAALAEAFGAFAAHDIEIKDMAIHINEMKASPTLIGWPAICDAYYRRLGDLDQRQLILAAKLRRKVFRGAFDAGRFFDMVERSTAVTSLDDAFVDFEDLDPLGLLYAKVYPALDSERKKACFGRVARLAVRHHRYELMNKARTIYGSEADVSLARELTKILDTVDPNKVIHGRGVIPRD